MTTKPLTRVNTQTVVVVPASTTYSDPSKFNQPEGEKYAFEKATDEVWKLEGYLLKQRMYEAGLSR